MRTIFCGLIVAVCFSGCYSATVQGKTKLVLLAIDGLRWDHFGVDLPNLTRVGENGVKAEWLEPTYITQSTPPLYSIATGLYTESHGVISNYFFDIELKKKYTGDETMNMTHWFDTGAEPIWVTAIQAGLRVGNFMYAGAQRPVKGVISEKVVAYSKYLCTKYSMRRRIEHVITWLTEDDLDVVLVYFEEPDWVLHTEGMGHVRAIELLKEMDEAVGFLVQRLQATGIEDKTDLIILSDHGVIVQEPNNYICIFDYINRSDVEFVLAGNGPAFQLKPMDGKTEKIYQSLKEAHPVLSVFLKDEFPERFHYGKNERNLPILGFVEPGWTILTECDPELVPKTSHGYDHELPEMRACFYAKGPSFKSGYTSRVIKAVDVYNLMCDILNLSPAPNNGTRSNYEDMLLVAPPSGSLAAFVGVVAVVVILNVWLYFCRSSTNSDESKPHDS